MCIYCTAVFSPMRRVADGEHVGISDARYLFLTSFRIFGSHRLKLEGMMALDNRIKTRINANVARIRAEARAGPPDDPKKKLRRRIAEAAYLMALLHGGEWRVEIDPHSAFVLIARQQRRRPRKSL